MLAKKNRKRILLAISVLFLCFFAAGLAGCESVAEPLPEEYQGYYRYGSIGCIRLGGKYCSACCLYVTELQVGDFLYTGPIRIEAQAFQYFRDGSFEFTGIATGMNHYFREYITLTGKLKLDDPIRTLYIEQLGFSIPPVTTECQNEIHNHE